MCALPNLDVPTVKSALMEPAFRVANPILTALIQKRAAKANASICVNNLLLVGKTLYAECQNTGNCVYVRMVIKETLTLCVLPINVKRISSVNQTKSATRTAFALIPVWKRELAEQMLSAKLSIGEPTVPVLQVILVMLWWSASQKEYRHARKVLVDPMPSARRSGRTVTSVVAPPDVLGMLIAVAIATLKRSAYAKILYVELGLFVKLLGESPNVFARLINLLEILPLNVSTHFL